MRRPRPRFTVRRLMVAVAISALILRLFQAAHQSPYYEPRSDLHDTLAGFCKGEEELMRHRADVCADRARRGAPWDDPSEAADDLKCCPYINDVPQHGSWAEQAAIWERAAERAKTAAEWHSRMSDYHGGRIPFPPRRP
jgi:hypothetical protein